MNLKLNPNIKADDIPISPLHKTSPNANLVQTEKTSEQDSSKSTITSPRPQCDPILEEEDRSLSQRRFSIAHHAKLDGTKSKN